MEEQKVTSGECQAILSAISLIQKANEDGHNDLRNLIDGGLKGLQLVMDANAEVTKRAIDNLSEKQAIQNGNVARLQEESDKRKEVVADFRRLEKNIIGVKKKWVYIAGGFIVLMFIVTILYDVLGFEGVINLLR